MVTNKIVISPGECRQTIISHNLEEVDRLFKSLKGHSKTGARVKKPPLQKAV